MSRAVRAVAGVFHQIVDQVGLLMAEVLVSRPLLGEVEEVEMDTILTPEEVLGKEDRAQRQLTMPRRHSWPKCSLSH